MVLEGVDSFYMSRNSQLNLWWITLDRYVFFCLLFLMFVGITLVSSVGPSVASRVGLPFYHFVQYHICYVILSLFIILFISSLSPEILQRFFIILFVVSIFLLILTLFAGVEVKGAKRWFYIFGISIQPSEFAKPCFVIVNAMILALRISLIKKSLYSFALYTMLIVLIISQPDFGMSIVVSLIWACQVFVSDFPMTFLFMVSLVMSLIGICAYLIFPHIQNRIHRFLQPDQNDNFQVNKSLEAFSNGGYMGVGPGDGSVKKVVPDAHTDFIFSVAGEEFGSIFCILILSVFLFIILRSSFRLLSQNNNFIGIAGIGLVMQLGMHVFINVSVALNLMPTKGMTLPFISYGGSSTAATAILTGALLSLTRTRFK